MKDRAEISDWQVVGLVALCVLASPVIIAALGLKVLAQWVRFRLSERCER